MNTWLRLLAIGATGLAATAFAGDDAPAAEPPAWAFGLTVYPTDVRGGQRYASAIATADHGSVHLEARTNYESVGARSAFAGWNLAGGETVKWTLTPLLGVAWGTTKAWIPGLEMSLTWGQFDGYVEAEHVRARAGQVDSYLYAWTELGFRPVQGLRVGRAGQRTRAVGNTRALQRGPLVQVSWGALTLGGYWFNPGAADQVFMGMIGAAF